MSVRSTNESRLRTTFSVLTFTIGVTLLATEGGCTESCHDELGVDIGIDLSCNRPACDLTFTGASQQVVYQCAATSGSGGTDVSTPCIPVGSAPALSLCLCGACGFTLKTQSNDEGEALRNALGGLT